MLFPEAVELPILIRSNQVFQVDLYVKIIYIYRMTMNVRVIMPKVIVLLRQFETKCVRRKYGMKLTTRNHNLNLETL